MINSNWNHSVNVINATVVHDHSSDVRLQVDNLTPSTRILDSSSPDHAVQIPQSRSFSPDLAVHTAGSRHASRSWLDRHEPRPDRNSGANIKGRHRSGT